MSLLIEDYAVIGDTQTAALVGRDGSIDWLCLPRFDSGACFASLLGDRSHGRWLIRPMDADATPERRYVHETLVLETVWTCAEGSVRVLDLMPPRQRDPDVVRIVEGIHGTVRMQMELIVRFDYGSIVPWVRKREGGLAMVAGPDALLLRTPVETFGRDMTTVAEFDVTEGERVPFVLVWHPSHEPIVEPVAALDAVDDTITWWCDWVQSGTLATNEDIPDHWRAAAVRSLITLKALTFQPTGGIVAAVTTSLPEDLGGVRNWDYRFCWLRDATFTLYALTLGGYFDEARAWFVWLLRAVAGDPSRSQIIYGPAGERRLTELELPWLPGYEGSKPVRIGNHASAQFQLDVYGEVLDSFHSAEKVGISFDSVGWDLVVALTYFVEEHWSDPDAGIWEVRGPLQHFTHSKVMAWVAVDRAVKASERKPDDRPCPIDRWREVRDAIHRDVCAKGFNSEKSTFTQTYGGTNLDASLLMMPLVGFLPASDPRVRSTVAAVQRELCNESGLVRRYNTDETADGLTGSDGHFLACSFWLVDNLALDGRVEEATALFERLLTLTNDVGLMSEEYDAERGRMLGNFPQAFSHVALVNSVHNLTRGRGPAADRATR